MQVSINVQALKDLIRQQVNMTGGNAISTTVLAMLDDHYGLPAQLQLVITCNEDDLLEAWPTDNFPVKFDDPYAPPKPGQIYARITPESDYAGQDPGQPFPVSFQPDRGGYIWKGGPGGQYRHSDLLLTFQLGDELESIPTFTKGDEWTYFDRLLNHYEARAKEGELYPEWFDRMIDERIKRLRKIARTAKKTYEEEEY